MRTFAAVAIMGSLTFGLAVSTALGQTTYTTTITPIYGGYQAVTTGQPQGISPYLLRNVVTPAAPLDYSGLLNASQNGQQNAANAMYQREAAENMRQQTRLMQQRARIEAEQYRDNQVARQQAREAELAEAKLRKELAEAKLAELKIKQAEEKARQDAAEPLRRQQAQLRYDTIAAQVQRELAESKAKQKIATRTPEQIAEDEKKASRTQP